MKVSVCITVKNEERSIGRLLDSLLVQTKKPDEIVIVDGGSTDKTQLIISNYQLTIFNKQSLAKSEFGKYPNINFQFIKTKKKGIAAGRNLAIQNAKNEIIVMIDAGCVAKRDWLDKIQKPFINNGDLLVAGYYEMPYRTPLQQVMSIYHGIPPQRFDEHKFLPSARSVAFTKTVWRKMGKFNERLKKAGEDTEFFYNCVKSSVKIIRVKQARVIWEETAELTLSDSLKKFYSYAIGDAKIGIWWHPEKQLASHNIKISLIFARYFLAFVFLTFGFYIPTLHYLLYIFISLYLLYPIYKWLDVVKSLQGRIWLPIVQILSDFAVMSGFIAGSL